jgi:hypothetical protein
MDQGAGDVFGGLSIHSFAEAVALCERIEFLPGMFHPCSVAQKPPIQNQINVL